MASVDPIDLEEAADAADALVDELDATQAARRDRAEADARLEAARTALAERLDLVREAMGERARTQGAELATWARATGGELVERAAPVIAERAGQAREDLTRRWHDLEEELPVDIDTLRPRAQKGLWQAIKALLGVLLALPTLLVKAVARLGSLADDVADRGVVAGERAKELAATVPPSKRDRRRRLMRTAAWTGGGFGVGLLVGWLLGQREPAAVPYEPADLRAHLTDPTSQADTEAPEEEPEAAPEEELAADGPDDAEDAEGDEGEVEDPR